MLPIDHILLIGFGGPTKPEEIRPFLQNVTKGKNIPAERLESVAHHYEVIGGFSPYNQYTFNLAEALALDLARAGLNLPVFVGMRNWDPYLKDTLIEIKKKNLKCGIGLVLAPHRSEVSYDRYLRDLLSAQKEAQAEGIEYYGVEPWSSHPKFVEAQAAQVEMVFRKIPEPIRPHLAIIFTNHSIPVSMADQSTYQTDFMTSSRLVADKLGLSDWSTAYQSRSGSPFDPWLEPDICDIIRTLPAKKKGGVFLIPIGFLCDNAEVLFDLDVEAKDAAAKVGISYFRASTVMNHPQFVEMWIDLIRQTITAQKPGRLDVTHTTSQPAHPMTASPEALDIKEKGAPKNGLPQTTDRRMYFQMLCFSNCRSTKSLIQGLKRSKLDTVLYKDLNDPFGIGVLLMSEKPERFILEGEKLFLSNAFRHLTSKQELTMLGRTYSSGREQDLEDWMLNKYRRNALSSNFPWAVWYPLRRKPEFALLTREEQGKILMEHAMLGQSYGMSNFAYDIRLSCYGIDKNDNEFVIGLVGPELYPLSRLVQDMRKTQQTTKYIQNLGPFFVGRVIWQSPYKDAR